jgi:hypothetical protein
LEKGTYLVSDVHVRVNGSLGEFTAVLLPTPDSKDMSSAMCAKKMAEGEEHALEVLQVVVVFIFDLLDPESALCNPHIQSVNRLSGEFGGTYDESTYHPPKQEREPEILG